MHSLFASILASNSSLLRIVDVVVVEELLNTDALVARLLFGTSLGVGSFDVDARLSQLNGERRTVAGFSWAGVGAVGIALRLNVGAGDDDLGAPLELVGATCEDTVEEREKRVKIEAVVDSLVTTSLDNGSSSSKETSSKEDVEILR